MEHSRTISALTTLSPIVPERTRQLRSRLAVVRYTPGLARPLLQLSFIHYARWIILEGLPSAAGGWYGLRSKYLLFEGTYDGTETDYLRTFADIVPVRLAKLWGACVGFEAQAEGGGGPMSDNLVPFGFRRFVATNELEVLDFFAAYPQATVVDVRQAIAMHDLVAHAGRSSDGEDAALERAAQVGPMALGPTSAPLSARERIGALYRLWQRSLRGHYGVNPITLVTPFSTEHAAALRELCQHRSVLTGLSGTQTHFARLALIPPWLTDVGQSGADRLPTSYLLFTSDYWGHQYDHIEALRTHLSGTFGTLREMGSCGPAPDDRVAFHAWADNHSLTTRYYVAGYPPRSVTALEHYLEQREIVAQLYADDAEPPASTLLAAMDTEDD